MGVLGAAALVFLRGLESCERLEAVAVAVAASVTVVAAVPVTVAVTVAVWLVFVYLRVRYAPYHVIAPEGEARFAVQHAVAAFLSSFPLRLQCFGMI